MSLASTNCGIASHVIKLYVKEQHNIDLEPHIGQINGMTFSDSFRPLRHVLLRNKEESVIVDPTALQVVGNAGLTFYDVDKFDAPVDEIIGSDRIFEVRDTPKGVNNFVEFIGKAVQSARRHALPVRPRLSSPRDGSQAFLDMPSGEVEARLTDLWAMDNYRPDPLEFRKVCMISLSVCSPWIGKNYFKSWSLRA